MSLNSFRFVIFFVALFVVMVVLQLLRKKTAFFRKVQLILLLAFSYFFILKSDWRFCICVAAVTVLTYVVAIRIEKAEGGKPWLIGGVLRYLVSWHTSSTQTSSLTVLDS